MKTPPTVVMDATHPFPSLKAMLPFEDPAAVIGRTSLPTLPVEGGWQSVWFSPVVEEIVDVLEEVENVVVVSVDVNIDDEELSPWAAATGAAGVPILGAYVL